MIAHLHLLKHNVERGLEKEKLGFLQDYAVIWLVLGKNRG